MDQQTERTRVLIVDDERGPRESLRMILAPTCDVLLARSGSEALAVLREQPVDLVTLDLDMPGMKGEDVMRAIRGDHPGVELIVITGCGTVASASAGIRLGIADYLQKPFDVVQVSASVAHALERRNAQWQGMEFLEACGHTAERDENDKRTQRLEPSTTLEFLEVLAETIETKVHFMRGHARRVAFYSELLAHRLMLPAEQHQHLRLGAFLHDLGKVGIPTDLLLRPAALNSAERSLVSGHPEIGARLIKALDVPLEVSAALLHHHEWWDGTGYPAGLAGEEIPLVARIIGVADAFDGMSSDRPYRRALDRDVVVAEIDRFAGVQFDPDIAKEFLGILETGVCEIDPELLAAAVQDATGEPPLTAIAH